MTANLERARELFREYGTAERRAAHALESGGRFQGKTVAEWDAESKRIEAEFLALLSPAQPPPEPAPRLSDERLRELLDEGAENGRRMAEAAKSMRPLAPPEPAPADWTRLARNAGWVSPEEQALAIRDATAPAVQFRVAVEALERIAGYCGAPGVLVCSDIASDALAKLRDMSGGVE